jgi:hypothetical protein
MKPRHPASRECRKRKCQKRCCRPEDGRDRRSKRVTTAHVRQGGGALGYMVRAFLVVNCQSTLMWLALRSCSQAAISSMRVCLSRMRRSRHWDVRMPSSYSARSSQAKKMVKAALAAGARFAWYCQMFTKPKLLVGPNGR